MTSQSIRRDRRRSRPLRLEVLESRTLLSANLILSGPQTLVPYANVNVSASTITGESEMTVAINPTNPLNVVGFSHNYISNFNKIQVFYSFSGGTTWTRVLIGGTGGVNSDGYDSLSIRFDPTVKFDANGNLYIGYGAYTGSTTKVVVAKSTDGGVTFPNADFRTIDDQPGYAGTDKFYLGTGRAGPATSDQAVYVAYERNPGAPVHVAGSKDGGATWTTPVAVGGEGFYAGPAVGPNGELYVVWQSTSDNTIRMRAKPDGLWGPNPWNPVAVVRSLNLSMFQFSIPPQSRRGIYNTPVIDVDRSGGANDGRVYVTFVDRVSGTNTDVFLSYSDNDGATWSSTGATGNVENSSTSEFHSWVAVDQSSGSVNILYKSNKGDADTNSSSTFVASSFDGGLSFLSKGELATRRSRALSAGYSGEFLDYTGFDAHDGTMHGFWSDNRGASAGTYTSDLESYTGKAAFVSSTSANKLVVNGDKTGPIDDTIVLRRSAGNTDFLEVLVNGVIEFAGLAQSVNIIELNGLGGNNAVIIQSDFTGIDITVNAGTTGRNLAIAGASAATLVGGSGEDILIGGTTAWDTTPGAIYEIMAEWSRPDLNFRQRMVHILRGGGYNGGFVLNPLTVTTNSKANLLKGNASRDVIFADSFDTVDPDPLGDVVFSI